MRPSLLGLIFCLALAALVYLAREKAVGAFTDAASAGDFNAAERALADAVEATEAFRALGVDPPK